MVRPPAVPALDGYLNQRPATPAGVMTPAGDTALQQPFRDAVDSMNATHPTFGPLLQ